MMIPTITYRAKIVWKKSITDSINCVDVVTPEPAPPEEATKEVIKFFVFVKNCACAGREDKAPRNAEMKGRNTTTILGSLDGVSGKCFLTTGKHTKAANTVAMAKTL